MPVVLSITEPPLCQWTVRRCICIIICTRIISEWSHFSLIILFRNEIRRVYSQIRWNWISLYTGDYAKALAKANAWRFCFEWARFWRHTTDWFYGWERMWWFCFLLKLKWNTHRKAQVRANWGNDWIIVSGVLRVACRKPCALWFSSGHEFIR